MCQEEGCLIFRYANVQSSGLEDPFVRHISGAPEPMTVLCFDWVLHNIHQFCCGTEYTILCPHLI
jgi:hypothetical protein